MTITLTSFKKYHDTRMEMPGYSIAVYQPRWYPQLPKIDMFDIREDGKWTLPRNFVTRNIDGKQINSDSEVLKKYHDTLVGMYQRRFALLGELPEVLYQDAALCCWCPYEKAAKRQLETYGTFVCHSWAVESFLRRHGIKVVRDDDRKRMVSL